MAEPAAVVQEAAEAEAMAERGAEGMAEVAMAEVAMAEAAGGSKQPQPPSEQTVAARE